MTRKHLIDILASRPDFLNKTMAKIYLMPPSCRKAIFAVAPHVSRGFDNEKSAHESANDNDVNSSCMEFIPECQDQSAEEASESCDA